MAMSRIFLTCAVCTAALLYSGWLGAESQDAAPVAEIKVLDTFQVGGSGGWDYPTIDGDAHRLYIARGTRVTVLDSETGKSVGEVPGLTGAHGVALVPDLD